MWFRADMDANGGVREATGLAYANTSRSGLRMKRVMPCTPAVTTPM